MKNFFVFYLESSSLKEEDHPNIEEPLSLVPPPLRSPPGGERFRPAQAPLQRHQQDQDVRQGEPLHRHEDRVRPAVFQ